MIDFLNLRLSRLKYYIVIILIVVDRYPVYSGERKHQGVILLDTLTKQGFLRFFIESFR